MASSTRGRGIRGTCGHGCGRDSRKCDHCGRSNHTSDKCWDKFRRPPLTHIASSELSTLDSPSTGSSFQIVTIPPAEYDQFLQMRATQFIATASHVTTSGTHALLAFRDNDWIIHSGASSHMTGTRDLFTCLSQLSDINSVFIADGRSCPVAGEGAVHASS